MSHLVKPRLVSVIVASYNHVEYLEQRMDSLISQTYKDIEILVIDDCSTDGSVEVLRKYETHPRVKLIIHNTNSGWVAVSNQGVELSCGEFVIFANCDDACDSRMIERLVEGMCLYPSVAISYCRSLMIDGDGKVLGDDFAGREKAFRLKCNKDTLISHREMGRFLLHSCVIPNLSSALFRRGCYINSGGLNPSYRVCSDWDLFFRIVAIHDVYYVTESLNEFRQHKTTIRTSTKERILYEELITLLLSQIALLDLTFIERAKYRLRVMSIWAVQILRPSYVGIFSFFYLLRVVKRIDLIAIIYLPIAMLVCFLALLCKLPQKILR